MGHGKKLRGKTKISLLQTSEKYINAYFPQVSQIQYLYFVMNSKRSTELQTSQVNEVTPQTFPFKRRDAFILY